MSRHEGTYVLRPASQPVRRATARKLHGSVAAASDFWATSGTREHSPRVRDDSRRRPRNRRAAGDILLTRDTSRELPWPNGPNVRGQMAAHGENLRQFLRIFDVFPWNPRESAMIFSFLSLWPIAWSLTTMYCQLSDHPVTSADSRPFHYGLLAPSPFFW